MYHSHVRVCVFVSSADDVRVKELYRDCASYRICIVSLLIAPHWWSREEHLYTMAEGKSISEHLIRSDVIVI